MWMSQSFRSGPATLRSNVDPFADLIQKKKFLAHLRDEQNTINAL
jgi:hypothetical protein